MGKKKLLIVESPSKADTIKKYLGKDYKVMASVGHIIDLPKSQLGVDVEHDFEPKYITIRGKGELLAQLKKEAKSSDKVYLATDPDREGEAISWHLANALKIDINSDCRVTFNEITKNAVKTAIKEPRSIDMDLVDAQQARRVLDRIVGYKISPILWEKVKKGLSAGRVQSVATKMICDREEEIMNFVPREFWTVEAELKKENEKKSFTAKYFGKDDKKEVELKDNEKALKIISEIKNAKITVEKIKKSEIAKNPPPPFTTSTLQQDASRKINFRTSKTMQTAQGLYEGVNIGGKYGTIGLITYMRTDSLRISNEAQKEAIDYITSSYGKEYLTARQYKSKKNAQDAHEAIRPTNPEITPEMIKSKLSSDQYKLYKLIWERFIASQMSAAVYNSTAVTIDAAGHKFRANGSSVKFKGFMAVYTEGSDEVKEKSKTLPSLSEGDILNIQEIEGKQHFTQPPARYTEASLVHELEENGIGRPSTYAPTISTILARGYIMRSKKQLVPTELGFVTTDIMKNNFAKIVDIEFTAGMESELDDVEEGKLNWVEVLKRFYPDFEKNLEKAQKDIEKIKIKDEESDVICDKCGRKMVYKLSKFGKFLACPGYPECKNTMTIREGTGVECPKCGGEILIKKSRKGKTYYACEHAPKCDFILWNRPHKDKKCPECGSILIETKGRNPKLICSNEGCGYSEKMTKKSENEDES
ncbi:MAG: type I DNA topoisomerase [Clostridia bacterium]|nr:type I DNA topoisomerase [Clostridia bacterium]